MPFPYFPKPVIDSNMNKCTANFLPSFAIHDSKNPFSGVTPRDSRIPFRWVTPHNSKKHFAELLHESLFAEWDLLHKTQKSPFAELLHKNLFCGVTPRNAKNHFRGVRLTPQNSKNVVRGVTPPNPLHEQAFWSRLSPDIRYKDHLNFQFCSNRFAGPRLVDISITGEMCVHLVEHFSEGNS